MVHFLKKFFKKNNSQCLSIAAAGENLVKSRKIDVLKLYKRCKKDALNMIKRCMIVDCKLIVAAAAYISKSYNCSVTKNIIDVHRSEA